MLAVVAARSTRRGRPIITGCVAIARRPQQQQRRYVQHTADAAVLATTLADSPLLQLPRALFDFTHTATGLPWWLTIPLATLALRVVVTLPSAVYARKQALIYERVAPVTALMAKLGQQRQQVHQQRNAVDVAATTTSQSTSSSAQIRALWRQHGYRPWAGLLLPLLQVPVFVCMSLALRSMCGSRGRGGPSVAVATTTSAADMVDVTLTTDDMIDTMAISAAGAASSDTSWLSSVTSYWTIHSGASPADSYIFHPFTHGGTLWFEDLTACDATMLSPLIIGALHVVNIQVGLLAHAQRVVLHVVHNKVHVLIH